MAQKFVHKVSPERTDDAQFRAITDIPAVDLTQGTTVLVYPGAYAAVTGVTYDNITFEGVGDKEEITFAGFTAANTTANTITFKNMTLNGGFTFPGNGTVKMKNVNVNGTNVAVESLTSCIIIGELGGPFIPTAVLDEVTFGLAERGITNMSTGLVTFNRCDAEGVDVAAVCNSDAKFSFSRLNTSSNAYFEAGDATIVTCNVLASTSGGSNGTVTTETIEALIS